MPSQRPTPYVQIRVIGPTRDADRILTHPAEHAVPLFGPLAICTKEIGSARRRGHVRAYFTVMSKEEI